MTDKNGVENRIEQLRKQAREKYHTATVCLGWTAVDGLLVGVSSGGLRVFNGVIFAASGVMTVGCAADGLRQNLQADKLEVVLVEHSLGQQIESELPSFDQDA